MTTDRNNGEQTMADQFTKHRRSQIAELRPYVDGEDMAHISVAAVDAEAGSPKAGDMIARNPKNHADQWLVAAQYYADNFEPVTEQSTNRLYIEALKDALAAIGNAPSVGEAEQRIIDLIDKNELVLTQSEKALHGQLGTHESISSDTPRRLQDIEDRLRLIAERGMTNSAKYLLLGDANYLTDLRFTLDALKSAPPGTPADQWRPLHANQVEWVVNDIAELGVKIGNQFFFCYKGRSLVYDSPFHEDDPLPAGTSMRWRHVFKREFGECVHPINRDDPRMIGTVSLDDSDEWQPLPAPPGAPPAEPNNNEALVTRIADALIDKIRAPYSYSNITNIIRGCVSRENIRESVSQSTPSPTGMELALETFKVHLRHLTASVEHELRCGRPLLASTVAYVVAAKKLLSERPQDDALDEDIEKILAMTDGECLQAGIAEYGSEEAWRKAMGDLRDKMLKTVDEHMSEPRPDGESRLREALEEMVNASAAMMRVIANAGDPICDMLDSELKAANVADGFGVRARAALDADRRAREGGT